MFGHAKFCPQQCNSKYLFLSHQRLEKEKSTLSFPLSLHPLSASFTIFVPLRSDPFSIFSSHLFPSLSLLVSSGCGLCLAVAAAGGLPDVSLCKKGPRGMMLKRVSVLHLQITLHDHFLLLTQSSQAALCAKARANRGVQSTQGPCTGPYSSSTQCSSLLLPYQPQHSFILKFTDILLSEELKSTGCSVSLSSGRSSGSVLPPDWEGKMCWCPVFIQCLSVWHSHTSVICPVT